MAQVGRISGPLLEANLLRQGIANGTQQNLSFKNTNSDTTLLKIDVANGRIGVDLEAPASDLHISQTTQTVDLIGDTANIGNFDLSTNNISVSGNFYLNADELIQVSNLETEQFYISDNFITTTNTNTNIDLLSNGVGTVEVRSNLNIDGNLHATENITFDGSVVFGDNDTDDFIFNADINDNLLVTEDAVHDLGSQGKTWKRLYTALVNGQLVTSGNVTVDGANLALKLGNIWYVSKNGDDANIGDHPQAPVLTIKEALSRCEASTNAPTTIYVYPGVYEEICPLVVPNNVTIRGLDIRNVIVKPTLATQDKDVFHLNDSSTIVELAIKDFYYNSGNNTGYAFRFAPGAVITNRSPYIQNVTVITAGSVTSASDPRGFDEGDAGRGAWIDGAELDSASIEASMLFHSATFICPNADVINMTNGVRVEWLNSFTYFANRGLYAFNGVTGRTTYDGSTVKYGAEIRSIGSANVYGNYGAVADGADTLMYLIQHNMAYIGAGKYVDNDSSRAIQTNEIVELNSGSIHYVTTNHTGNFRIGDNFLVDFETGNTTINLDDLVIDQFSALRINQNGNTTLIDGSFIDVANFTLRDNTISSNNDDINISASNGQINLQDDVNITGNLDISGDFSYAGSLNIKGDEPTDSITFNVQFEQNFNPNQHQTFNLGSFTERWLVAHLDRIESNDITIYDNVIETNISNADLELRAASSNKILVSSNNLNVSNNVENSQTATLANTNITGTLSVVADIDYDGNINVEENLNVTENIYVTRAARFEEILVDDNFITTTTTNADLELRASGTGIVNLQTNVNVDNNLSANNVDTTNVTVTLNTTSDNANIGNVEINDNYIETTSLNGDLTLASTRDVVVTGTDVRIVNDLTVSTDTSLQDISISGLLSHTGNTEQVGNVTLNGEWTNGNIYIEDNFITTTQLNSDLDLRATGNVIVPNNNVILSQDLTISGATNLQNTSITGTITHTGDYNQTGNYAIGGELTVDNVYVEDNFITATLGNLTLEAAGTGSILAHTNNVAITNNLDVDGITNLDVTNINGNLTNVGDRIQTGNYDIAGELSINDILIEDNFITTTASNADLELRAPVSVTSIFISGSSIEEPGETLDGGSSGTSLFASLLDAGNSISEISPQDRIILVPSNDVEIANNLTVIRLTSLTNTTITGSLLHTGDRTQTGNYTIAGEISNGNILIEDNFISTTNSNSDLELRANGTGEIIIDPTDSLTIENNLFVEGTMYYTGSLTINGNVEITGTTVQDGSLNVVDNFNITGNLNVNRSAKFEEILVDDNFITTTLSNSNLELRASGTGEVLIPNNNVQVNNNLFAASISTGDITVNNDLVLDELVITDSNIEINENYISTKISNADLELRATGDVVVQENAILEQNLTIAVDTSLQNTAINGNITHTGNRVQNGNYNLTGNLNLSSLIIDSAFQFDDVRISGNVLETTLSNSNLDLRASGTGNISLNDGLTVNNNVSANDITILGQLTVDQILEISEFNLETNIKFRDNFITTTESNSDLEILAAGTGSVFVEKLEITSDSKIKSVGDSTFNEDIIFSPTNSLIIQGTGALRVPVGTVEDKPIGNTGSLRFDTDYNLFESTSNDLNLITLGGVFSGDRRTKINANSSSNSIEFIINGNVVATSSNTGLTVNGLQVEDININNKTIATNVSNSDLELRANGTGDVVLGDIKIKDNIIKDSGNNLTFKNTGFGKVKFNGTSGIVIPYGTTSERPVTPPPIGDTRWNTTTQILETWDGNQYLTAAGVAAAITPQEFDDLLLEFTLIFG